MVANRGIWLDEATTITQAQRSLGGLMDSLAHFDVHPPLHHLIRVVPGAHAGHRRADHARCPDIAGAVLVPVLYLTATELWDRRAGLVAALLGAVAPFLVWYGQEARMYSLFMLFATLALLGQLRALRRGSLGDWTLYVLASAALMWTQYFGVLVIAVQQGAFLLVRVPADSRFVRAWLLAGVALLVLMAPLVPLMLDQFQANEAAGKGFDQPSQAGADVSDTRTQAGGLRRRLTNLVWALWGYHSDGTMAAIHVAVAAGSAGRAGADGPRPARRARCSSPPARCCPPPPCTWSASSSRSCSRSATSPRSPRWPCCCSRASTGWTKATLGVVLLSTALATSMAAASADQLLNRGNPRVYDFEGALQRISAEARPGDVVLYQPQYLSDVVRYYAPGLKTEALSSGLENGDARQAGRVFVLASFQDQPAERAAVREGLQRLDRGRDLVPAIPATAGEGVGLPVSETTMTTDPRLAPPTWDARGGRRAAATMRVMALLNVPLAVWYFGWLLQPGPDRQPGAVRRADRRRAVQPRPGARLLVDVRERPRRARTGSRAGAPVAVDVFVPVYNEPVEIVEPTVAAAAAAARRRRARWRARRRRPRRDARARRPPRRRLHPPRRALGRQGRQHQPRARAHRRAVRRRASTATTCPTRTSSRRTLGRPRRPGGRVRADPAVLRQRRARPDRRRRRGRSRRCSSARSPVARTAHGAMFCCGTNVVFRRAALEEVGGFPDELADRGLRALDRAARARLGSVYVPEVLARGLGPGGHGLLRQSQQHRWARGCLSGAPARAAARAAVRQKVQYLLSASYFLSGWTVLIYMALPVIRILTARQPIAGVVGRRVPAPLRAVLRARADDGRARRRRARTRSRRSRSRRRPSGSTSTPRPRAAPPPGPVRRHAEEGRRRPPAARRGAARSRPSPCSRPSALVRARARPEARRRSTTSPSRCSTSRSSDGRVARAAPSRSAPRGPPRPRVAARGRRAA